MHVVNGVCSTMPQRYCTTLHPTNSLSNSTRRHKVHVRLYECESGVCYLQQLPLGLCRCTRFYLRDLAPVCAVRVILCKCILTP